MGDHEDYSSPDSSFSSSGLTQGVIKIHYPSVGAIVSQVTFIQVSDDTIFHSTISSQIDPS